MSRKLPPCPPKSHFRDPKRGNSNWRCRCTHKQGNHSEKGCHFPGCDCKRFCGIVVQMFR